MIRKSTFALRFFRTTTLSGLLLALSTHQLSAQSPWTSVGPSGGDVRALVSAPSDPTHLYLGTTYSWIMESINSGASWHRLAQLDKADDIVVRNILPDRTDPATILAGGWRIGRPGGGLWISHDAGKTWQPIEDLREHSVLSVAQAPSSPKTFVAGTLEGVYRSVDGGLKWQLISPPGSNEVHEVESLAIEPANADIIYAGTWHLPWRTADGGKTWHSVKQGIIDDSDVFSILIDPIHPRTIFLSACSGIYKSETAGELFHKIQGIPSTARRTRVLRQDPVHREIVYAGTTEGLYKTVNAGRSFERLTGPEVIVNDVFVDPTDTSHVLIATDRGGVEVSRDGGATFVASNDGFSGRKLEALLVDHSNPARIYAGVVNDKSYGGVYASTDSGASWSQLSDGLADRDIFALSQTSDGVIVAGTSHGIFALESAPAPDPETPAPIQTPDSKPEPPALTWQPKNLIANTLIKRAVETHFGKRINIEKQEAAPTIQLESRVEALDVTGPVWLATSGSGLLTSHDKGASWQGGPVMASGDYLSVATHGTTLFAARPDGVVWSTDGGDRWQPLTIPTMLTHIHALAVALDGGLWLGSREGVFCTHDNGKSWLWVNRLPFRDVDDLSVDPATGKLLVSSRSSDQVFVIDPATMSWKWFPTGYRIGMVRMAGTRIIAASVFDGVIVQPKDAEPAQ